MPMYNFDPAEEQDDLLEQELLDHGREGSLTGPNAKVSSPGRTDMNHCCSLATKLRLQVVDFFIFLKRL